MKYLPARIEGLHHTAFCVTDLARARRFYSEALGLTEIERPDFPFGGAWYEFPDGRQLHLIVHERPLTLRGTREIDPRDGHIALRIADYDAAIAHFRAHGIECVERPDNVTPWKQLYVTDPDGNIIELNVVR